MKHLLIVIITFVLLLSACKKDAPSFNSDVKSHLSVEFDNIAGSSNLQLNTGSYSNALGEAFTVSKLKYYVSNFTFTKADGTVYTVPQAESYFLIDESKPASLSADFQVPEGEYKTLSFIVGVDSLRSTMDITERTGVLDPTGEDGDMYWGWNSGYIFFKMEGTSTASTAMEGSYMYHVGGFGGYNANTINNIKTITIDLSERGNPQVKTGKEANIHLMVDVLKMFNGGTNISIAKNPMIMFDPLSTTLADNYANMFKHDHTEN
jgi:hypothetical protein